MQPSVEGKENKHCKGCDVKIPASSLFKHLQRLCIVLFHPPFVNTTSKNLSQERALRYLCDLSNMDALCKHEQWAGLCTSHSLDKELCILLKKLCSQAIQTKIWNPFLLLSLNVLLCTLYLAYLVQLCPLEPLRISLFPLPNHKFFLSYSHV